MSKFLAATSGHIFCGRTIKNGRFLKSVKTSKRPITISTALKGQASRAKTIVATQTISKLQAQELVLRLDEDERQVLLQAIEDYHCRLKGRCTFTRKEIKDNGTEEIFVHSTPKQPEEEEKTATFETKLLLKIGLVSAFPFLIFGFMDNFMMLVFGDYIDYYLGSYLNIKTMTSAAIGNAISDVIGIGLAFHVEKFAQKFTFTLPKLCAKQVHCQIVMRTMSLGRILGITVGCIAGMCPLLFLPD